MKELIYLCAQPATNYYAWQVEVMLHNFLKHGIQAQNIHIVCGLPQASSSSVGPNKGSNWDNLRSNARFQGVKFVFYPDTRHNSKYIPSIRPHILAKHWHEYPDLANKAIFYHDCDIVLTQPLNLNKFLVIDENDPGQGDGGNNTTIQYLSDTKGYIGGQYILGRGRDYLEEMSKVVGIDAELILANEEGSGGAQSLLQNIDANYWERVYEDSENLYRKINQIIDSNKKKDPKHIALQAWTADMWAMLWNLWKRGWKTECPPELEFCWPNHPIEKWQTCSIMHNASITNKNPETFYKGEYMDRFPYWDVMDKNPFNKDRVSYQYVEQIRFVANEGTCLKSPLLLEVEEVLGGELQFIVLIQNCQEYASRRRMQRATWCKDLPSNIYYLHIQGDPRNFRGEQESYDYDASKFRFDASEHLLQVPEGDYYEHLPQKLHSACQWVYQNFLREKPEIGVFKTDDDTIAHPKLFQEMLERYRNWDYYGIPQMHHGATQYGNDRIKNSEILAKPIIFSEKVVYCLGAGYYLSSKSVKRIAEAREHFQRPIYDDVYVGELLSDLPAQIIITLTYEPERIGNWTGIDKFVEQGLAGKVRTPVWVNRRIGTSMEHPISEYPNIYQTILAITDGA